MARVPSLKRTFFLVLWAAVAAIFLSAVLVVNSWAAAYWEFQRSDGQRFVVQVCQTVPYGSFSYRLWKCTDQPWNPELPENEVVQILAAGPGEPGGYAHGADAYYQGVRAMVDFGKIDNTTFTQTGQYGEDADGMVSGEVNVPVQAGHIEAVIGLVFALIFVTAYRWHL